MSSSILLITGASGFLGGAVTARALTDPRVERVLLLVRAASESAAFERVSRSLSRFMPLAEVPKALSRIGILRGDLSEIEAIEDRRLDDVTHVLHAAANTSFRSVRDVHRTNVEGALALARRMRRAPRLERYVHVSTAFCCGVTKTPLVREGDAPRADAAHVVEYTRSKALCELRLSALHDDLPLVVARPSIIVGHTELGCAPSASLFWYYRALARIGWAPWAPERARDIVPVDYVARALELLLFATRLRERVYHVSAGEGSCARWGEICAAFERHGEGPSGDWPSTAPGTDGAERALDPSSLRRVFGPGDAERLSVALSLCARFASTGADVFDNRRLLAEGMPPPPRFVDYLDRCLSDPPRRSIYRELDDDA